MTDNPNKKTIWDKVHLDPTFLVTILALLVFSALVVWSASGQDMGMMERKIGQILMGLVARLPYALAPGMGLNAFFTFELVLARGIPKEQALGLVVLSGIVFLALSATPLRRKVANAIPESTRRASITGDESKH